MKLIVGLGNFPKEYKLTRHNMGFLCVDFIQENNNFDNWQTNKKLLCDISSGILDNQNIILIKPNTYMNLSGDSVIKVINFYKITNNDIIIIHDELDFDFGIIKTTQSRNSAGHNGVKSINARIPSNYTRIRIGIGRPKNESQDISSYVLSKFSQEEQNKLEDIYTNCSLTIKTLL